MATENMPTETLSAAIERRLQHAKSQLESHTRHQMYLRGIFPTNGEYPESEQLTAYKEKAASLQAELTSIRDMLRQARLEVSDATFGGWEELREDVWRRGDATIRKLYNQPMAIYVVEMYGSHYYSSTLLQAMMRATSS